ncbi:hypothetical protein DsansV1_C13g0122351 [Dioscorea sansibarensis]
MHEPSMSFQFQGAHIKEHLWVDEFLASGTYLYGSLATLWPQQALGSTKRSKMRKNPKNK